MPNHRVGTTLAQPPVRARTGPGASHLKLRPGVISTGCVHHRPNVSPSPCPCLARLAGPTSRPRVCAKAPPIR
ncbi:hypothetical protein ACFFX0_25625 [Citricoccus parietis]|uniref:Uncharacterized protein n=1 Tax=Citricoccus parietis TaxID=592307 RepID=A0ABV5G616_9MICC